MAKRSDLSQSSECRGSWAGREILNGGHFTLNNNKHNMSSSVTSGAAKRKKRKQLEMNAEKQREAMGRYLQSHKKDDSVIAVPVPFETQTPSEENEPGTSSIGNPVPSNDESLWWS